MKNFLKLSIFVMIGGGCGTLCRFFTIYGLEYLSFPVIVLVLNALGCFVCGILLGILENRHGDLKKAFIFIGFLGAYTTLSDVSLFFNNLILKKEVGYAIGYAITSLFAGLFFFSITYFYFRKRFLE